MPVCTLAGLKISAQKAREEPRETRNDKKALEASRNPNLFPLPASSPSAAALTIPSSSSYKQHRRLPVSSPRIPSPTPPPSAVAPSFHPHRPFQHRPTDPVIAHAIASASPPTPLSSHPPSTPLLEVNREFGGDLHEPHSDLASVHSTQSALASAGSFTMAAALVG